MQNGATEPGFFRPERLLNVSESNIIVAKRQADGTLVQVLADGSTRALTGTTDWARLDAMTDEEVMAAALSDPDAQPLTKEQLARMKPLPRAKTLRRRLGLTQEQFAAAYHIPVGTLRDWEQGRSEPDQPARAYLHVIAADPEGVARSLREHPARPPRAAE
jgi:putative transcriptional regulator